MICQNLEETTRMSFCGGRISEVIPARQGKPLSNRTNHLPTHTVTWRDTEESQSHDAEGKNPESERYAPHGPLHRTFWKRQN